MSGNVKKKKAKFNVIDVLIIFLVVVLIATVAYRVYTGINDKTSPSRSQYVITFDCDGEYNSIVNYLTQGKAVYLASNGKLLGHMYAPNENGSAYITSANSDGESSNAASYDKVSIRGYISMSSETVKIAAGNYYSIGDVNLSVGSTINVYTNDAEFTLTVKSIDAK